ncbi:cytochrome c oxidase assembly protein [Jatrophihabitans telluris]|uniref:Cytochrome c oxidase assembly protein n=1 Tax=Jatrophihabitans telluris TaxID=2038343 RepID=A0ABY4R3F7_9ACTN|nr:cytochrome c oxidase assembly protein [Jatrophihabitans telluris]UQX89655.1 cytochrome c oxidase assembly protein [Jatrophihabitans telluris]
MLIAGVQPVMLVLGAVAAWGYLRRARRTPGGWPWSRSASFLLGILLVLALTCGPAGHRAEQLFWFWLSQSLALLLIAPLLLMGGQPLQLFSGTAETWWRDPRWARPRRAVASPVLGAGLVPLTCAALLFGPVPGWSIGVAGVGWITQLLLLGLGLVVAYPLIAIDDTLTSTALGLAVGIGLVELLLDAVPGIVMRLSTHPVTNFFDYRHPVAGQPSWLHDQQIAGATLWCVAELLDLPFLILIFRRWISADEREAVFIDASLPDPGGAEDSRPWFMSDPQLRDRFR